ncbi:unnamed protein product [Polarella glacialis]|uniref:Uncharacterized protein n=1 Tax=Polarella glacialis TaxID=89957 RepID=A0A813IP70_POLGL|nr:unnamed protein product [Polarella glacialis]
MSTEPEEGTPWTTFSNINNRGQAQVSRPASWRDAIVVMPEDEDSADRTVQLLPGPEKVKKYEVQYFPARKRSKSDELLQQFSIGTAAAVPLSGVLGGSTYSRTLRKQILERERDDKHVLIFGEPGVNKDMFAFLIHFGSAGRKRELGIDAGRLLFIECATVSSKAARLFGSPGHPGLSDPKFPCPTLDLCERGTLVLNNVDRLNKQLLRQVVGLIATGSYWSSSELRARQSQLRIIVSAERQLPELNALPPESLGVIKVPALRVRRKDIRSMVTFELRRLCRLQGLLPAPPTTTTLPFLLLLFLFPGNVDELFALVAQALRSMPPGGSLTPELFWTAQSVKKLDMFKVNLLDVFPGLRPFLSSDFLETLNHDFTKYAFAVFVVLLFIGPQARDANFGLNLFWAWWWPGILLTYPLLGRLWCAVCPFMIYGEVVQRWRLAQGAVLGKWPTADLDRYGGWFMFWLFVAILLWEELWVLEDTAYLSSCLLLLITAGAMVGSWFFERRVWCRHLCPIGGMNGLFAKLSLVEVRGAPRLTVTRLYSHPASLKDNRNCVLCMTCLKACPHQSVQLNLRAPGIDFGFPFLFPVPGTAASAGHEPRPSEVALLFLLFGCSSCYFYIIVVVWTAAAKLLEDFGTHAAIAAATLAAPGLLVWSVDITTRACAQAQAPEERPMRPFVELAYSYLPLVWLSSLAHYMQLGLTEAGYLLPVAARTAGFFATSVEHWVAGGSGSMASSPLEQFFARLEAWLPGGRAPDDVVAFLQGSCLLLGAALSSLMLTKLGGKAPFSWVHHLLVLVLTLVWPSHVIQSTDHSKQQQNNSKTTSKSQQTLIRNTLRC